jgi:hypothetical protein
MMEYLPSDMGFNKHYSLIRTSISFSGSLLNVRRQSRIIRPLKKAFKMKDTLKQRYSKQFHKMRLHKDKKLLIN